MIHERKGQVYKALVLQTVSLNFFEGNRSRFFENIRHKALLRQRYLGRASEACVATSEGMTVENVKECQGRLMRVKADDLSLL